MKNLLYCALLFVGLCSFAACSNGEYIASPDSNANGSINPLDPLKAEDFNWSGNEPFSADINGVHWVADNANWILDSGRNVITATSGTKMMQLYLKDVYATNVYNMGYKQYDTYGYVADSIGEPSSYYMSIAGNSGGVYILKNDSLSIKGLFYFQGINAYGKVSNVINGYFNVSKR